jgi:hypothetical protein
MAYRDNSGLTACYHVISMLEAQLRSAHDLRERLETQGTSTEHHAHILKGLCSALLDEAVGTAQAVAMLRDEICNQRYNSAGFIRARKPDTLS